LAVKNVLGRRGAEFRGFSGTLHAQLRFAGRTLAPEESRTLSLIVITAGNNSTRPNIGRLQGKLEGNRSTWESIAPDKSHGSRFLSEQLDATHWRRTQFVSEDGGKTWKVLFADELERDPSKD
jgi:hypothetical protein